MCVQGERGQRLLGPEAGSVLGPDLPILMVSSPTLPPSGSRAPGQRPLVHELMCQQLSGE